MLPASQTRQTGLRLRERSQLRGKKESTEADDVNNRYLAITTLGWPSVVWSKEDLLTGLTSSSLALARASGNS